MTGVIYQHILFAGRFEIDEGQPLDKSDTALVVRAKDRSVGQLYSAMRIVGLGLGVSPWKA